MKYNLTTQDYIYLQKKQFLDKRNKHKIILIQIYLSIIFFLTMFISTGITGNGYFIFYYVILSILLWILTGKFYKLFASVSLKKFIINNPIYTEERDVFLLNEDLHINCNNNALTIPLKNIKTVEVDLNYIFLNCFDGIRIIPLRVFESETAKGQFIDAIKH